jgi:hypothetical protein
MKHLLKDLNKFKYLGCGCYGVVFGNYKYAIKVGDISESTHKTMVDNARKHVGIPVYAYYPSIRMPQPFVEYIFKHWVSVARSYMWGFQDLRTCHNRMSYYDAQNYYNAHDEYMHKHRFDTNVPWYTDMMIMARATPIDYNRVTNDEADSLIDNLKGRVRRKGGYWWDDHLGNMGHYKGRPVVLDI